MTEALLDDEDLRLLYQVLLGVGLVVTISGMAMFLMRRKVFPLNGRVTSFVIIWACMLTRSFMEKTIEGFDGELLPPCWYRVARAHFEIFGINVVTMRLFRLWYLLFTSKERLNELRGKRARARKATDASRASRTNVSTTSAYSNGKASVTDVSTATTAYLAGLSRGLVCEFKAKRWFVKRAYLAKGAFLWKVILVASVIDTLGVQFVFWFAQGANRCGTGGSVEIVEYFVIGRIFMTMFIIFAFGHRIRNESDNYSIKTEFKLLGIVVLFIMPIYILEGADVRETSTLARTVIDVVQWCFTIVALYAILWLPVLKSYGISIPSTPVKFVRRKLSDKKEEMKRRHRQKNSKRRLSHEPSLKEILSKETFEEDRVDFENLLAKEFSIENLQFYETALEMLEHGAAMTDGELATFAVEIYRDFVADESPSEINIPHTLKKALMDVLAEHVSNFDEVKAQLASLDHASLVQESMLKVASRIPYDMYEPARKAIYSLMANDTYQRWLRRRRSITYVPNKTRSPSNVKRVHTGSHSAATLPSAESGTSAAVAGGRRGPSGEHGGSATMPIGGGGSMPSKPTHRRASDVSVARIGSKALFEIVVTKLEDDERAAEHGESDLPPPVVTVEMPPFPANSEARMPPSPIAEVVETPPASPAENFDEKSRSPSGNSRHSNASAENLEQGSHSGGSHSGISREQGSHSSISRRDNASSEHLEQGSHSGISRRDNAPVPQGAAFSDDVIVAL